MVVMAEEEMGLAETTQKKNSKAVQIIIQEVK